jgi:hypothetical protein
VHAADEGFAEELPAEAEAPEREGGVVPAVLDVVADEDLAAEALVHVEDGEDKDEDGEGAEALEGDGDAVAAAALQQVERVGDAGGPYMPSLDASGLVEVVGVGAEAKLLFCCWNVAEPAILLTAGVRWLRGRWVLGWKGTWTLIPSARLMKAMIMMYIRM